MKYERAEKVFILFLFLISIVLTIAGLFSGEPFWDWAWARHQNILSWVVRPMSIPILIYFSYRRSWTGILATVVATITSMYWFPAPAAPNELVQGFLASEQDYLLGTWDIGKILVSSLVPISLGALVYAFWKRSIWGGIAVVNLIAFTKALWSVVYDQESGWVVIPFALIGLAVTDVAIYYFILRQRNK